jgi:hypothetical protein
VRKLLKSVPPKSRINAKILPNPAKDTSKNN